MPTGTQDKLPAPQEPVVAHILHVPVPAPVVRIAPISNHINLPGTLTSYVITSLVVSLEVTNSTFPPTPIATSNHGDRREGTPGVPGVMPPNNFNGPTRRARQRDLSQTGTSRERVMTTQTYNEDMVAPNIMVPHTGVAKPPTPDVRPLLPPYSRAQSRTYSAGASFVTPRPSQPRSLPPITTPSSLGITTIS